MAQPRHGAGRETLASTAASPAQIGHDDDTTAEEVPLLSHRMPRESEEEGGNPRFQNRKPQFSDQETPVSRDAGLAPEEAAPPAALRNSVRRERGEAARAAALAWADLNPSAFAFVESRAVTEAAAERPVSVRALLEDVRRKDFTDREGRPTRVNNSVSAALGRLLVERNPAIGPWVAFRQSVVDEIGG